MSKQKSSLEDVSALIDERRQYEKWLEALEGRRSATAQHVYDRVHSDYQGRLDRVNERLATHTDALVEERDTLQSRLSLIEGETKLREDERAEVDLRAAVGELSDGEVKKALKSVDETLNKLRVERDEVKASLDQVTEFLALANGPAKADEPEPVIEEEEPAPAVVVGAELEAKASEGTAESAASPEGQSSGEGDGKDPGTDSPPERAMAPAAETAAPAQAAVEVEKPAPVDVGRGSATDAQTADSALRGPKTPRGSFDELRFLNSIVADSPPSEPRPPSAPRLSGIVRDEQVSSALMSEIDPNARKGGELPFAANVASNTPIKLRVSGQLEPQKTLKCSECGSLNYPTEWYCERCGAELAAL
jgi:hypothetical protein